MTALLEKVPIRLRLSLLQAIILSTTLTGLGYGILKLLEKGLYYSVDAALISAADSILSFAQLNVGKVDSTWMQTLSQTAPPFERYTGQDLFTQKARIIQVTKASQSYQSMSDFPAPLSSASLARCELGLSTFETIEAEHQAPFRLLTVPWLNHGRFSGRLVQVGTSLDTIALLQRSTALLLAFLLPLIFLLTLALGYLVSYWALNSVQKLIHSAATINAKDLGARLDVPAAQDELRSLALTFNNVLDHLEEAMGRLQRFSADVAHELRTPLAVMMAESELSLRQPRSSAEYVCSIKNALAESKRMAAIVEDLLFVARAEASALPLSITTMDLRDFVTKLLNSISPLYGEKKLGLRTIFSGRSEFTCSYNYLEPALRNILVNAYKYGKPNGTIHVKVHGGDKEACFSISNCGEGIAPEDLPYVFDPFFRADRARNRKDGGIGIGLALTKSLIKLQRGSVQVTSQLGQGAKFEVRVPELSACG